MLSSNLSEHEEFADELSFTKIPIKILYYARNNKLITKIVFVSKHAMTDTHCGGKCDKKE